MSQFKDEILQVFPYLFEKLRFEFVDLDNDYGGNVVVAQSDTMRIRFVDDRADFFLDIGQVADPDRWIEFYKIINTLKAEGRVHSEYKYSNKVRSVSRLLELYFSQIQNVLLKKGSAPSEIRLGRF